MADEIKACAAIGDKDARLAAYQALLPKLFAAKDVPALALFLKHMTDENTSTILSRPLLTEFVTAVKGAKDDVEFQEKIINEALSSLSTNHASVFEEQMSNLRYLLSKIYIAREDFVRAAQTLQEIPLDGGRVYPLPYKVKVFVKIAQLYLHEEKSLEAERFLNKAAPLVNKKGVNPKHRLLYQTSFVQIRDFNRKFSEAASGYYRLAQLVQTPEERQDALEFGVRCAVLSPAGPQRSRLLALFYKDEQAKTLATFPILEKMFLERVIRPEEIAAFQATLDEHQLAKNAQGVSILDQAIREHNLLAASRVYNSITFEQLGSLIGVPAVDAEHLASRMISEGRMRGSIDQLKQLLYFRSGSDGVEEWDSHIERVCMGVNEVVDLLVLRYPQWIATHH